MGTVLTALRWLLVPVSIAFACWFGMALALLLFSAVTSFCPADKLVSGFCTADWATAMEEAVQYAGAAVGAALAVLLPHLLAPSRKRLTAAVAFVLGAAFAIWVALSGPGTWPYAACAIVSGLLMLVKTRAHAAH